MGEWSLVDRAGYASLGEVYERSRPDYPDALIERLLAHAGVRAADPVAEIGAGTGRFTAKLAQRGLSVSALEPVPEMRRQAPALPNVNWSEGTFEHSGLADRSQRWVVSAQAFQWAETQAALPEISRILKAGGWFTILWNAHDIGRSHVLRNTYARLREHIPEYRYVDRTTRRRRWSSRLLSALPERAQLGLARFHGLTSRGGRGLELQSTMDFGKVVYHEQRHRVATSREGYLDVWRSRIRLRSIGGPEAFEAFLAALADDLTRERVTQLDVPYVCGAWSARQRHPPS